jgi:hypothetical protein
VPLWFGSVGALPRETVALHQSRVEELENERMRFEDEKAELRAEATAANQQLQVGKIAF